MNRLSCLEHLSALSLSTEMSEMMLQTQKNKHDQAPLTVNDKF